jgi:hypothetical protein
MCFFRFGSYFDAFFYRMLCSVKNLNIKGTQAWEFFGLRYWILYFFVDSYAEMLRFRLKKNFSGPLLGEIGLFCVYWDYAEWKKNLKLGKFFVIFQVSNVPFIFSNNRFSHIWSINSYSDGFISQNVKLYLAYTEYKRNQV